MFRGKKYQDAAKQIEKNTQYDAAEGFGLICKTASAKFDETVELHVKLGVDSRHADQQVRGAIVLPNGTGKNVRVLVFAKGDKAEAAKAAGADYVGEMDLVEKIQKENWFDFDVVVASPDMMGVVGRLGKVLGPKGLMPSPKAGTVTPDVAKAVQESKAGKVEYRLDKTNIIHCPIGKVSFGADKLYENYSALIGAIIKAKPAAAKGQYIKSCVAAATMGPGVKINPANPVWAEGLERNYFCRRSEGNLLSEEVWPGLCNFPDFTAPAVRSWWADLFRHDLEEVGVRGLWNDMNEPVVFPDRTFPMDALFP